MIVLQLHASAKYPYLSSQVNPINSRKVTPVVKRLNTLKLLLPYFSYWIIRLWREKEEQSRKSGAGLWRVTQSAYEGGLGGYIGGSLMGFLIMTAGSGERTNVLNPLWDGSCVLSLWKWAAKLSESGCSNCWQNISAVFIRRHLSATTGCK